MARIFVIEEHTSLRVLLHDFLREAGHSVFSFDDGPRALALASPDHAPDLVLVDLHLTPQMDGRTFARLLRSQVPCPVLAVSGTGVESAGEDLCEVLPKPFEAAALLRKIDQHLALARAA